MGISYFLVVLSRERAVYFSPKLDGREDLAVVCTGFRDGGGPGSNWGILFNIGEIKNFAVFQTRKFSKNVKKINEKFIIF